MGGSVVVGGALFAFALYVAATSARDFRSGIATFKFKWTYPKLEAEKSADRIGFWILSFAKLWLVIALMYVSVLLVMQK